MLVGGAMITDGCLLSFRPGTIRRSQDVDSPSDSRGMHTANAVLIAKASTGQDTRGYPSTADTSRCPR